MKAKYLKKLKNSSYITLTPHQRKILEKVSKQKTKDLKMLLNHSHFTYTETEAWRLVLVPSSHNRNPTGHKYIFEIVQLNVYFPFWQLKDTFNTQQ